MTHYKLVALTNAETGLDEDYNRWYDTRHVFDVLAIPGFKAVQRFKASASSSAGEAPPKYRYLAIYDIETDDLGHVMEELGRRVGTELMPMSPALSPERYSYVFEPISGQIVGDGAGEPG